MILIGISTMGSSSACIFRDNTLLAAVEEERLSRIKNDGSFPIKAIKECLKISNINIDEVDYICVYWKPFQVMTRILGTLKKIIQSPIYLSIYIKKLFQVFIQKKADKKYADFTGRWSDLFFIKSIINNKIGFFKGKIIYIDHHLSHQCYAENIKKIKNDFISMSFDGGGESYSTVLTASIDNRRKILKKVKWPNSLGHYYSFFTGYLGFKMLEGEYKMMGLSPYGKPIYKQKILDKILRLKPEGNYIFNHSLCNYHLALEGKFNKYLESFLCPPRLLDNSLEQHHLDLAASVQEAFEEVEVHLLNWAKQKYPYINNLVLSGGCSLNVSSNGKVLNKKIFSNIQIPPASHDAGCSVGAVLAFIISRHSEYNNEYVFKGLETPYLGASFDNTQIEKAFIKLNLPIPKILSDEEIINVSTEDLVSFKVLAWFQGRSEFGPRALGCRSFLADPRNDKIRESINLKIKKRELFRPFAPSVIDEFANEYFDLPQDSPYMNIVAKVKKSKKDFIPAVIHIDNTARIHTVNKDSNEIYYKLLQNFREKTGVPVLLNTSFNIQEPIVYSPFDAIRTFLKSDVDSLVIGNYYCNRNWKNNINA